MGALQWNDHIQFVAGEMSWRQQLDCTKQFGEWLKNGATELDSFQRQVGIVTLLLLHTPIKVYCDGVLLPPGTHDIGDVMITLPLDKDGLESLPASIATYLVTESQKRNATVLATFLDGVRTAKASMFVPSPANSQ